MKKIILLFLLIFLSLNLKAQVLFTEDFNYPAGDSIGAHGWVWNTGTTNTIFVTSPGLTYTGYIQSNIGNACHLRNNGNDAYKSIIADSIGSVYVSFMVRIDSAQANGGDYFFALLPNSSTANYTARTYVKDTTGGLAIGISKGTNSSNPISWSTGYSLNTTYLVIVKYTFNTGSTTNDEIRGFVFSGAIPSNEPGTPTIGPVTGPATDAPNIGRVAIRQGSASIAPTLNIDGFRVFKNWSELVSIKKITDILPDEFSLGQNYPNPFNPETKIRFEISKTNYTNLTIFNSLGQAVETVVNNNLTAGIYEVNWDASGYPSGLYFYRLTAGDYTETKKMQLIK